MSKLTFIFGITGSVIFLKMFKSVVLHQRFPNNSFSKFYRRNSQWDKIYTWCELRMFRNHLTHAAIKKLTIVNKTTCISFSEPKVLYRNNISAHIDQLATNRKQTPSLLATFLLIWSCNFYAFVNLSSCPWL